MVLNACLKLKGQKTGEVKGSGIQTGREGLIMVIAAGHQIVSPRDAASGLPTGKRIHKPFVITKELDKSSPLLYKMLTTNENILEWELRFWDPSTTGVEIPHYTVKLTNAFIAEIRFCKPNNKIPELTKLSEYEEVSFTYEMIEWCWNEGGIKAQDSLERPV